MSLEPPRRSRYPALPGRSARRIEADLDEEVEHHLEMRVEELTARGLSPEAARAQARREFGGVEAMAGLAADERRSEALRSARRWLDELRMDIRFALRGIRRSPGWAGLAVLTMGVGIGAATAMLGAVDALLLRPLGIRDQDRVVVLWTTHPERQFDRAPVEYRDLVGLRESGRSFADVGGYEYNDPAEAVVRLPGGTVVGRGARVTGDLLPLLGVVPLHGRSIHPGDDVIGSEPVAVVSEGFWRRHFGGDPAAVGQRMSWSGQTYTIVGVLPGSFAFPNDAEFWTTVLPDYPDLLDPAASPDRLTHFYLVGRLRTGSTPANGAADFSRYLEATDPERQVTLRGGRAVATPYASTVTGGIRTPLRAVGAAGVLILLLACVNVAGLLLVRNSQRTRELAIRSAIGAGRRRIARQMLTETGILALIGGAVGVVLAVAQMEAIIALAPAGLPRVDGLAVDLRLIGIAVAATFASALLAGAAPALAEFRRRDAAPLGTRGEVGSTGSRRVRGATVVLQTAIALTLVTTAGLMLRTLRNLQSLEMGFATERLIIGKLDLPPEKLGERPRQLAVLDASLAAIRRVPGVEYAAAAPVRPFSGMGGWDATFVARDQPREAANLNPMLNLEVITGDYFETLGAPLLRGRGFTPADTETSLPVAIVSRTVAERIWPGEDPIGKQLKIGDHETPLPWHTVVGVAPDTRYRTLEEARPTLYLPIPQLASPVPSTIAIRSGLELERILPPILSALQSIDADLVLANPRTVPQLLAAPLARPRFSAHLLGGFAVVSLLLAGVGAYGTMSALLRARRGEVGVRLAFGALPRDILGLGLHQGFRLALAGAGLGVVGSLVAARAMRSMLFGVAPADPGTLIVAVGTILGLAALASFHPAWRASRADPAEVLRSD